MENQANGRRQLSRTEQSSAIAPNPNLDLVTALEEITRNAQHVTEASGAALALSDGKTMSCRACSGYLAPPVGTQLNTNTGLTAACVQTATVVRCDDTQADPRADSARCNGIRSILAVPLFNYPDVAGVLEVLSHKPKNFTDRHLAALQLLARLVETCVNYVAPHDAPSNAAGLGTKPAAANREVVKHVCGSCGHPNPRGSQFCNRCGVIVFVPSDSSEGTTEFSLPEGVKAADYEGVREIYKLISGSAGLATWGDISAKLLANLQASTPQNQPRPAAIEEPVRRKEIGSAFRVTEGANDLTARKGAAIRRSLWL